jgi:cell migration-inducing and hyaluronan-binding protein
VVNDTFVNYQDNATRKAGAVSYLLYTSFGVSTENSIERAKFINAKPVHFPPMERKWGNDNGSSAAWKVAAIHDKDGSVSGVPNSYILINDGVNDSIATDAEACVIKADWNAAVCKGDVGRLSFAAPGGFGAPPPRPAGAAGPAAPAAAGAVAGGPPPAGAPPRPAGGFGAPPPPQPPVVLSRNGRNYTVAQNSNVRSGTEIKVTTERPTMNLNLTEMDSGSWVILELPGFSTAAAGSAVDSLDALRKSSATSYYKGKDALWVKVVSDGNGARVATPGSGTSLLVSR